MFYDFLWCVGIFFAIFLAAVCAAIYGEFLYWISGKVDKTKKNKEG